MAHQIRFDNPTPIEDVRKYTGKIKPRFGRGTGAGVMSCPKCGKIVGNLLNVSECLVIGWIETECSRCRKTIDYSGINEYTLNLNVIPCWMKDYADDLQEQTKLWKERTAQHRKEYQDECPYY